MKLKYPKGYPQKESDLSTPVVQWLEAQGYQVNQEVKSCDITALKGEELILLELKLRFSLTLVYQALERKEVSPSVYIVIPLNGSRSAPPQYKRMRKLLQNLQVGLMVVRYMKSKVRVEVLIHPREYRVPNKHRRKEAILREINSRYGEFNKGGQATGALQMTAYRQQCLHIAWLLSPGKELSPAELRNLGTGVKTQSILSQNHYGWFDRVSRGLYKLHPVGNEALEEFRNILEPLIVIWQEQKEKRVP